MMRRGGYKLEWAEPAANGGMNPVKYIKGESIADNLKAWEYQNQAVGYARFFVENWVATLKEAGRVADLEKKDKDDGEICYCKVLKVSVRIFNAADLDRHEKWLISASRARGERINRIGTLMHNGYTGNLFAHSSFAKELNRAPAFPAKDSGIDIKIDDIN